MRSTKAEGRREGGRVARGMSEKKNHVVVMEARPVCESPRSTLWGADDKDSAARRRRMESGRRRSGASPVCWRRRVVISGGREEGDVHDGARAGRWEGWRAGRRKTRTRSAKGIGSLRAEIQGASNSASGGRSGTTKTGGRGRRRTGTSTKRSRLRMGGSSRDTTAATSA